MPLGWIMFFKQLQPSQNVMSGQLKEVWPGQLCKAGNALFWDVEVKEEPWQGHHTMQRVRKQQPPEVRTIPPATSSNPLHFASSSEYQPPLLSCVASMLTSGS